MPNPTTSIIDARLRRTLELCARAHPYYQRIWAEQAVDPAAVTTIEDLVKLPLTAKSDFMAAPETFVLDTERLPELPLEERTLWNVAYTTGTTSGRPSPFYNTTHDQYHIMLQARVCNEVEGLRANDVIANLYPLSPVPIGGFLCCVRSAEILGVPVVSTLTGSPHADYPVRRSLDEAVRTVARTKATVLWGVPSFVRRLLRRAGELNVALPHARMVLTTGEAVDDQLHAEFVDHLRSFGATDPQVRVRYAATEMQGGLVQCSNGAAPHHVVPDLYHLEVVDPDTGATMPTGEEGMLALTHLHRRGTVLLRYLIGDVLALTLERCPNCGHDGQVISQDVRRVGQLVKVKGMLVNPAVISEALAADRAIQEYQVVVRWTPDAGGLDREELVVRVEAAEDAHRRLALEIPHRVRQASMVGPRVEFVPTGTLYDPARNIKATRFVDERSGSRT